MPSGEGWRWESGEVGVHFSNEDGERLLVLTTRMFDRWGLTDDQRTTVLGRTLPEAEALVRDSERASERDELHLRMSHLMGIWASLQNMYPHNPEIIQQWMSRPDRRIDGATPLQWIDEEGIEALEGLRDLLDHELTN